MKIESEPDSGSNRVRFRSVRKSVGGARSALETPVVSTNRSKKSKQTSSSTDESEPVCRRRKLRQPLGELANELVRCVALRPAPSPAARTSDLRADSDANRIDHDTCTKRLRCVCQVTIPKAVSD